MPSRGLCLFADIAFAVACFFVVVVESRPGFLSHLPLVPLVESGIADCRDLRRS